MRRFAARFCVGRCRRRRVRFCGVVRRLPWSCGVFFGVLFGEVRAG